MNNPYKPPEIPPDYKGFWSIVLAYAYEMMLWVLIIALFPLFYLHTVVVDKRMRMSLWPVLDLLYLFLITVVCFYAWYGTYMTVIEFWGLTTGTT